ncbi:amino acid/polyamine/organocation transporter, APC superfamily [Marininema mesophilum]|uniref:Amino acid/polyamine/organocation transporter, APC superfamily n=1 Tax=Marininema mesophilum TaxID=1048340 RepID=A0A1H2Q5N1_9BACL|nr:amino acid permease [Marininema mesophilum]SDW02492.1 amino acid/polyamine/organocation transporter, APC superfamily [Marininema mesophilum]
MSLFRKRSIDKLLQDSQKGRSLKRDLGTWDLTLLGIGAIIGTGIFVLTGQGSVTAGPGLILSFIISAIACGLAALAYAEFAALVPISGSAYTYSYATLGEFVAWIIGWDLVLEYLLATSTVSVGWSGYFQNLLQGLFGWQLPTALTGAPGAKEGAIFNLPAFLIVMVITFLLSRGITESKRTNNVMVAIKVTVVLLFIAVGANYVKPDNWQPFLPFGASGVMDAAAMVFFAYIGFDAVAAAAEETKNPARDLPRGLIFSLGICTLLYIIVTGIMTGIVPFGDFKGVDHPISLALQVAGQDWMAGVVDLGAILGMTTVMLVMLYGQTRIFFSMSRDGLLPRRFSKVHPKFQTPFGATWFLGIVAGLIGGFVPLDRLAELVNIGTLAAFTLVSVGVLVLRKTQPNLKRPFRTPLVPFVPLAAIAACIFLMSRLAAITWIAFVIWLVIGLLIYFTYSKRHSTLNKD